MDGHINLRLHKVPKTFFYIHSTRFITIFKHRLIGAIGRTAEFELSAHVCVPYNCQDQASKEAGTYFELVGQKMKQLEYKIIVSMPKMSCSQLCATANAIKSCGHCESVC